MRGDAFKINVKVLRTGAPVQNSIEYLDEAQSRCEFLLPVLAELSGSDSFKNDVTSVYFGYSDFITGVVLKLYKCDEEVKTLNNNDYGVFYSFGFHEDEGKKYIGYKIYWQTILQDLTLLGAGTYYIKAECTTLSGSFEEESFRYCLSEYTNARADQTVRLEWQSNGYNGNENNDRDIISYKGLNWYNSLRLPNAIVNREKSSYEIEETQYSNGQIDFIKNEQTPEYTLEIAPIPNFLHKFIKTQALQSDELKVSDYNANNPLKPFLDKDVIFVGGYEPNWQLNSKNSSVNIQLKQKYNNLRKIYC